VPQSLRHLDRDLWRFDSGLIFTVTASCGEIGDAHFVLLRIHRNDGRGDGAETRPKRFLPP